jgi:hypothetical protein
LISADRPGRCAGVAGKINRNLRQAQASTEGGAAGFEVKIRCARKKRILIYRIGDRNLKFAGIIATASGPIDIPVCVRKEKIIGNQVASANRAAAFDACGIVLSAISGNDVIVDLGVIDTGTAIFRSGPENDTPASVIGNRIIVNVEIVHSGIACDLNPGVCIVNQQIIHNDFIVTRQI